MKNYTIKSLAKEKGHSQEYVRRAIREGKLNSSQEQIAKNTFRHIISEDDYKAWRAERANRSQRSDGRNKYTAYFTKDELEAAVNLLTENGFEEAAELIARTNQPKS